MREYAVTVLLHGKESVKQNLLCGLFLSSTLQMIYKLAACSGKKR